MLVISQVQIFMEHTKIQVSEIFIVLIFVVGESGICELASAMAKT